MMRKFSPEGESSGHLPPPATNQEASSTSVRGYHLEVRDGNSQPSHCALHYHLGGGGG